MNTQENIFTHGSLFSGIGGFDIASEWIGWRNAFHCEINEFCTKILKYHFPNAEHYTDITKTDFTKWRGKIDILSGGFPCQPFSVAGKRKGTDDNRYLWPEMLRAIQEIRPTWIVGENVAGIVTMVQPGKEVEVGCQNAIFGADNRKRVLLRQEYIIETICKDIEREGYRVQPIIIPACAVGAPHRRDRVWFIANTTREGLQRTMPHYTIMPPKFFSDFPHQSPICRRNDGLSDKLDDITFPKWREESIKAYGNAIVPQVAYEIFKAIQETYYKPKNIL